MLHFTVVLPRKAWLSLCGLNEPSGLKSFTVTVSLSDCEILFRSSYTEFSSKHGKDERYKAVEKARDREAYFNEFIADVRKKEKEDREKKKEMVSTTRYDNTRPHTILYENTRLRYEKTRLMFDFLIVNCNEFFF